MEQNISHGAIAVIVIERLNNILVKEFEFMYDDIDAYASFRRMHNNNEPTKSELYQIPSDGHVPSKNKKRVPEILAQCFVENSAILYNCDAIARWISDEAGTTSKDVVCRMVDGVVAHERRHTFQPETLTAGNGPYMQRVHELDALYVQDLVTRGVITLEEIGTVATPYWNPNTEKDAV